MENSQSVIKLDDSLRRQLARPFQVPGVSSYSMTTELEEFMRTKAPLDLEIGCGVGWQSIAYAKENPTRHLIAIEHTKEKFLRFAGRLARHPELNNLRAVHANAISFVAHHVNDQSLDRILLFYPNPNPKLKHRNQRWHAMPFMGVLLGKLKPSGYLQLVTNEDWYMEEARALMGDYWQVRESQYLEFDQRSVPGGQPRTHFEKKYLDAGQTCYQSRWCPSENY